MWITQTTSIGFEVPNEYKLMLDFMAKTDMGEWKKSETTQVVYFTQKKTSHVKMDEGKHDYIVSNFCPNCGADMRGGQDGA